MCWMGELPERELGCGALACGTAPDEPPEQASSPTTERMAKIQRHNGRKAIILLKQRSSESG
jgi:hypothetical protein